MVKVVVVRSTRKWWFKGSRAESLRGSEQQRVPSRIPHNSPLKPQHQQ